MKKFLLTSRRKSNDGESLETSTVDRGGLGGAFHALSTWKNLSNLQNKSIAPLIMKRLLSIF